MADLNKSEFFSLNEFPNRELEVVFASQELFTSMDTYRRMLAVPIFPSPVEGALSRFEGSETSRHYVAGKIKDTGTSFLGLQKETLFAELKLDNIITTKLSTAMDIFIGGGFENFWKAYTMALSCGLFGGVGVYAHTQYQGKAWPMLHLDNRPHVFPTIWARANDDAYIYPLRNTMHRKEFLQELSKASTR